LIKNAQLLGKNSETSGKFFDSPLAPCITRRRYKREMEEENSTTSHLSVVMTTEEVDVMQTTSK